MATEFSLPKEINHRSSIGGWSILPAVGADDNSDGFIECIGHLLNPHATDYVQVLRSALEKKGILGSVQMEQLLSTADFSDDSAEDDIVLLATGLEMEIVIHTWSQKRMKVEFQTDEDKETPLHLLHCDAANHFEETGELNFYRPLTMEIIPQISSLPSVKAEEEEVQPLVKGAKR